MASFSLVSAGTSTCFNRRVVVAAAPGGKEPSWCKLSQGAEEKSRASITKLNALSIRENQYGANPGNNNGAANFRREKNAGDDLLLSWEPPAEDSPDDDHPCDHMAQLEALAALRQGRILGESQVFRQTYVIRSYEVGAEGTTSIDTILSLFQEVALNHVSLLGISGTGFGATKGMNENRLIWVITRLHVEVLRYPTWPEAVEIDSWVAQSGKNGMRRDWLLREHSTGHVIAKATSTWAMMHQDTRRLAKLPDVVRAEITPVFIERSAMGDMTFNRIAKLDDNSDHIRSNLTSCRTDLDVNQHINNVKYIRWVMESVPPMTMETHEMTSVTLEYRRECQKDDIVESLTSVDKGSIQEPTPRINGTAKGDSCSKESHTVLDSDIQYTHLLRMQSNGDEIVRGRSVWKSKNAPRHRP